MIMRTEDQETMKILLEMLKIGEIGLNDHRSRMLQRAPESGDWAAFQQEIDPADIVWLAAKTGDCFAILRGRGCDILLHGQKTEIIYDGLLDDMQKEGKLKLAARCHPGDLKTEIVNEQIMIFT